MRDLLAAGYEVAVHNGGKTYEVDFTTNYTAIAAGLFHCDEEHLCTRKIDQYPVPTQSFIYLVYGNSGWDVVCDWGLSLDHVMGPINDYIDRLTAQEGK